MEPYRVIPAFMTGGAPQPVSPFSTTDARKAARNDSSFKREAHPSAYGRTAGWAWADEQDPCLSLLNGGQNVQGPLHYSPAPCTEPAPSGSHWGSRHEHGASSSRLAPQRLAPYWNPWLEKLYQPGKPPRAGSGVHPSTRPGCSRPHCQSPWLALESREEVCLVFPLSTLPTASYSGEQLLSLNTTHRNSIFNKGHGGCEVQKQASNPSPHCSYL